MNGVDILIALVSLIAGAIISTLIHVSLYRNKARLQVEEIERRSSMLAEREHIQYKNLFVHSSDGIVLMDEEFCILQVNKSFLNMFEYKEEELLGNPLYRFIIPSTERGEECQEGLLKRAAGTFEAVRTKKNGMAVVVEISVFTIELPGEHGIERFIYSQYTDITKKKETEKRIRELAYYDTLTSLPNRWLLNKRVQDLIRFDTAGKLYFSLIYIDLNGFKHINDTLGHNFGDELLVAFSSRIKANIKNDDFLARIGGDEFVLLLPMTSKDLAGRVMSRITKLMDNPFLIEGQRIFIGASSGIAQYPDDTKEAEDLFRYADIAMYAAKRQKKGVAFYTPELLDQYRERLDLEQGLYQAIQSGDIDLYYQPVIDIKTMTVASLEALSRWNHPEKGIIPSAKFISIAEDSHLIVELGKQMLRKAFAQAAAWRHEGQYLKIAVNLSAKELVREDTVLEIERLRKRYPESQGWIQLEITEAVSLLDMEHGTAMIRRIKELGFSVILDDFGTGYSSLSFLKDMHIDGLKIDRRLVESAERTNSTGLILKGLLHLASILRIDVVAEGVSDERVDEVVKRLGFTFAQGYHYSPAIPAQDVPALLQRFPGKLDQLDQEV